MNLNTQRMSRAESKEQTRRQLLDSARKVFAEKGFNAATVEEIAAGAGFTRGAFYANFEDKADCFWTLVEAQETSSFAELGDRVAATADRAQLEMVEEWFADILSRPELTQAFNEAVADPRDERSRQRLAAIQAQHLEAIREVITSQAAVHGFTLQVPVEHLAMAFFALGSGLLNLSRVMPGAVPGTLYGDAMSWLFLGASTPPADGS